MLPCKIWTGATNHHGYPVRYERTPKGYRARKVQRKMLGAGPGQVVRHKCNNTRCVEETHIHLGTQAQNVADTVARGRNGHAPVKLTSEQVQRIRVDPKSGRQLAIELGVSRSLVTAIRRGQRRRK